MLVSRLAAVVLASVLSSTCSTSKSTPTAPSTPTPDPPPDQSRFEPLGTRHYLTDENGNPTKMWAELVDIKPLRGSKVVTGPFSQQPDCSQVCYSVTISVGVDDPLSRLGGSFQAGFTRNVIGPGAPGSPGSAFNSGQSSWVCSVSTPINGSGECKAGPGAGPGGSTNFTTFEFVPRYLSVAGEYRHGTIPLTVTTGATNFEVDYQSSGDSSPVVPASGSWTGQTLQGRAVSFTVSGSRITRLSYQTEIRGANCLGTPALSGLPIDEAISGNSFAFSGSTDRQSFSISGTFLSSTSATGTLRVTVLDVGGACAGSSDTMWNASVQP